MDLITRASQSDWAVTVTNSHSDWAWVTVTNSLSDRVGVTVTNSQSDWAWVTVTSSQSDRVGVTVTNSESDWAVTVTNSQLDWAVTVTVSQTGRDWLWETVCQRCESLWQTISQTGHVSVILVNLGGRDIWQSCTFTQLTDVEIRGQVLLPLRRSLLLRRCALQ